ncbi:MAG: glycosyltransferase family 2 protein [Bacteroidia bacterium]
MPDRPIKVSICIPAYKQVEFLRRLLESVKAQNFPDYEVIVTDDSPDDAVEQLVREFDFEGKLIYRHNTPALGSPANWNSAIALAKGEYIKIMHHDDWFAHEQSLREFIWLLDEETDADFGFSATSVFRADDHSTHVHCTTKDQLKQLEADPKVLFYGNFIGPPSVTIFRRKKFKVFDENVKYVVDIDQYIRMIEGQAMRVIAFTPEPLTVSVSNSKHQVTFESQDEKTQVKEYIYLYNKIWKGAWPKKVAIQFFQSLFLKYRVHSFAHLQLIAADCPRPTWLFRLLLLRLRLVHLFKRTR